LAIKTHAYELNLVGIHAESAFSAHDAYLRPRPVTELAVRRRAALAGKAAAIVIVVTSVVNFTIGARAFATVASNMLIILQDCWSSETSFQVWCHALRKVLCIFDTYGD
jgi:hypothetical protein